MFLLLQEVFISSKKGRGNGRRNLDSDDDDEEVVIMPVFCNL